MEEILGFERGIFENDFVRYWKEEILGFEHKFLKEKIKIERKKEKQSRYRYSFIKLLGFESRFLNLYFYKFSYLLLILSKF